MKKVAMLFVIFILSVLLVFLFKKTFVVSKVNKNTPASQPIPPQGIVMVDPQTSFKTTLYYFDKKLDTDNNCSKNAITPNEISIKIPNEKYTRKELIIQTLEQFEKNSKGLLRFTKIDFDDGILTLSYQTNPEAQKKEPCEAMLINEQIEQTTKQFPEVTEIRYVNGN